MAKASLGAALIVKNEQSHLPACLESLVGIVDEVVVYDTGSSDRTVAIAQAAGARVRQGHWDGDFARARNAALSMARSTWVLSIDADERLIADRALLRRLLASARDVDMLTVRIRNLRRAGEGSGHDHPAPRLLRRVAVRWAGAVHEQPRRVGGGAVRARACPAQACRLDHLGYADLSRLKGKALRNNEIAQASLDAVVAGQASANSTEVASLLLHLGRSRRAAGDRQGAVDALETLRQIAPGTTFATEGTVVLAEVLLDAGMAEPVLVLADALSESGTDAMFCDWLRARALLLLDRWAEALVLLRGIERLVDPVGRVRDIADVLEVHVNVAIKLRQQDEAIATLLRAMAEQGRVAGRGPLLLRLWSPRPPEHLAHLLLEFAVPEYLDAVVAELRSCAGAGAAVADALAGPRVRGA